ncbi:MAG: hypothetical protein F6J93_32075 [Oscillatoria sp. SIO1A7]|nr:hypothetical protein [Oscillatoria sp. SIO1A7]
MGTIYPLAARPRSPQLSEQELSGQPKSESARLYNVNTIVKTKQENGEGRTFAD